MARSSLSSQKSLFLLLFLAVAPVFTSFEMSMVFFHVMKDSWILASHTGSEIKFLKRISDAVRNESLSERMQVLSPRFVAGEEHIHDTDETRQVLTSQGSARIHRRIITGPIGDPITAYRSRVECLQALVDIVAREYHEPFVIAIA